MVSQSKRKLRLACRFHASHCQYKLSGHKDKPLDKLQSEGADSFLPENLCTAKFYRKLRMALWKPWIKTVLCIFLFFLLEVLCDHDVWNSIKCVSCSSFRTIQSSHVKISFFFFFLIKGNRHFSDVLQPYGLLCYLHFPLIFTIFTVLYFPYLAIIYFTLHITNPQSHSASYNFSKGTSDLWTTKKVETLLLICSKYGLDNVKKNVRGLVLNIL